MSRPKTIKPLKILGQIPIWTVTEEDEDSYRWELRLMVANSLIDVNAIIPSHNSPRPYLKRLESLIRKLDCRFEENRDALIRWYTKNRRTSSIPKFRKQIMSEITLFVDFVETPNVRRLIFHNASDFQELEPVVKLDGALRV